MRTFRTLRFLYGEYRRYGLRVAWLNARFMLGYKIGGFTSAQRH